MPTMMNLGSLKKITDLRTVWPNEASDFTPWLADNIELLNEATGLTLEVVEKESPVGSFSLDILAQDVDTNTKAIIENQLENTDHDHLGKLLTYAAGKGAKYIIWVVKSAKEEHRAAIEWLNNNTSEEVGFFLCEIELWSVNGSIPAPRLNVVEQPNDWAKIIKKPSNTPGGAAVQFKYDYWTAFNDYAFRNQTFASTFNRHKASSDHWYTLNIGSSEAHINLLVNTKTNVITVEMSIPNSKSLYANFYAHKTEIESVVGEKLDWRELEQKKASRILLEYKTDLKDNEKQKQQFEWFIEKALAFKKAFAPYL